MFQKALASLAGLASLACLTSLVGYGDCYTGTATGVAIGAAIYTGWGAYIGA